MLPNRIVNTLNLFDICCYDTGSSKLSKNRKIINFIYFVHILLAILLTFFEFRMFIEYYPLLGLSEAFSELLQYSTPLFTYWLIIMDSILHRKSHQHFWESFERIHDQFNCRINYNFRSYFIKFFEFFSVSISIVVIKGVIISFFDFDIECAYAIIFKVVQLRIFYYLFCLEIVHSQLNAIENEVKSIERIRNRLDNRHWYLLCTAESDGFHLFALWRLKRMREYVYCVHQMIDILNTMFGWSHVTAILFCFYLLLTDFNWFFIHFNEFSYMYCIGNEAELNYYLSNFQWALRFSVMTVVFVHWSLLILYIFHSAANCGCKVYFEKLWNKYRHSWFKTAFFNRLNTSFCNWIIYMLVWNLFHR